MPSNVTTARDEILSRYKDTVTANPSWQLASFYDDTSGQPSPTSPAKPWARAVVKHATGRQDGLSDGSGKKRYERGGLFTVQLFTEASQGQVLSDQIATTIRRAFEGYATSSGVWFRNGRLNEIGKDGVWFQVNVVVEFVYDEVQ